MQKTFETARDNLGFVAVCLGVFAGLFVIAFLFERLVMKERRRKLSDTYYIAYVALFSAMAGALMLLEIPLFFAPSFYKLDLSEIPVMISSFYLGPVAGVVTELIKIIIKLMFKPSSTMFVGEFANFAVGCSFMLPAACIYHMKPGKKTALWGLGAGTAFMTVFGSAFNALYLIPKFSQLFHMDLDKIVGMGTAINPNITSVWTLVFWAVVPFNLIKGVIVSLVTFLLYKRISPLMHKLDGLRGRRKREKEAEE